MSDIVTGLQLNLSSSIIKARDQTPAIHRYIQTSNKIFTSKILAIIVYTFSRKKAKNRKINQKIVFSPMPIQYKYPWTLMSAGKDVFAIT
jgi:hypothetical protein